MQIMSRPAGKGAGLAAVILLGLSAVSCAPPSAGTNGARFPKIEPVVSEFIFTQAPFEQCHASTLVELPDGSLAAAWFGGAHEGDGGVKIWGSIRRAGAWSPPEVLASEPGVPCWNPVLFRNRHDKIFLFYRYGSSPKTWKGAYRTSLDGRAWSGVTYLPEDILGPIKDKPITLANGDILAGTSVETPFSWTGWVDISRDDGGSWSRYGPIKVPWHPHGIIQPTVWEASPGHVKMLARATGSIGRICEATSDDGGRTWSAAQPTSLPNPNSGIDAVKMADGRIALAFNYTTRDRSPLNLVFSRDNGATWDSIFTLEDEPGEYSYPAIIQTQDGMLHITYTWKRERIKHVVIDPRAAGAKHALASQNPAGKAAQP